MTKFTTGLIAGGIIGAVGLSYAMSDKRTRRRFARDGRRMVRKASGMFNHHTW